VAAAASRARTSAALDINDAQAPVAATPGEILLGLRRQASES
jgi:hypothetical protein